jgi:hypothetical protein
MHYDDRIRKGNRRMRLPLCWSPAAASRLPAILGGGLIKRLQPRHTGTPAQSRQQLRACLPYLVVASYNSCNRATLGHQPSPRQQLRACLPYLVVASYNGWNPVTLGWCSTMARRGREVPVQPDALPLSLPSSFAQCNQQQNSHLTLCVAA